MAKKKMMANCPAWTGPQKYGKKRTVKAGVKKTMRKSTSKRKRY